MNGRPKHSFFAIIALTKTLQCVAMSKVSTTLGVLNIHRTIPSHPRLPSLLSSILCCKDHFEREERLRRSFTRPLSRTPSVDNRAVGVTCHKSKGNFDLPVFLSIRASIMAVMLLLLWDTVALRRVSMVLVLVALMVDHGAIAVTKVEVDLVIVVIITTISLVHLRVLIILIVVLLG